MKGRYSRDYRLSETFDERGRVRVDYEYIGEDWHFVSEPEVIAREKRLSILLSVSGWAAFIGALIPVNAAMHRLYIALPFIFLAVPLSMYLSFVISFHSMKEPLEHRHADRLNNRYPLITFLIMVFALITVILEGVLLVCGQGMGTGDWIFEACALFLALLGAASYRRRDHVRAEKSAAR